MGVPKPPLDLNGHCSVIHNDTLFIYSSAGLQSLSLKQGAQWQVLPAGVSVSGGVCVNAITPGADGTSALYIVGGATSQSDYAGLQRFIYSTGQWESLSPQTPVTQNRRNHGAAYRAESATIAVYAGSQDPDNNNLSSQTFLISTAPPFNVLSFTSSAPPLTRPMLMPWNASHALMVGGSDDNTGLFLFGKEGWSDLGTSIPKPITDHSTMCSLVTGDDGSKVLEEYNLGASPNTITRYLLWSNGHPAPAGLQIGTAPSAKLRRDLTANNWPPYNATGAPSIARKDYSVAQAPNGYAVISGGSDTEPVVIFNERQNSWVDTASIFGAQAPISVSSGTTSSTGTKTSSSGSKSSTTSSPSNMAAPAGSSGHGIKVLGAALGAVLAFAALLILILLCLKRRSDKKMRDRESMQAQHEKENNLRLANRAYVSGNHGVEAYDGAPHDSVTSLQIFQGKVPGHKRQQKSDSSTVGLVHHKSPLGETDPMEMRRVQEEKSPSDRTRVNSPFNGDDAHVYGGGVDRAEHGRSAGWSQYFSGNNNVTDLGAVSNRQGQTFLHDPRQSTRSSEMSQSEYEDSRRGTQNTVIHPLELNYGPRADGNHSRKATGDGRDSFNYVAGRAVSTGSGYDTGQYWPDNRTSQISGIMPVPPIGSGPSFGNAFARPTLRSPNVGQATPGASPQAVAHSAVTVNTMNTTSSDSSGGQNPGAHDFPMPKAYLPPLDQHSTRPGPSQGLPEIYRGGDARNPVHGIPRSTSRSGPVIRKMTGDEDMSWLNINAGRPI